MTEQDSHIPDEDATLMVSVQNGDMESFNKIILKYQNILLNYFYYLNANMQEAEDLTQDTFLKLFQYREKYLPTAKLRTFLFRIAKNTAIDFFRKMKPVSMDMSGDITHDVKLQTQKDHSESSEDLRVAINLLPEKLKEVIVMSYFQDLKYQEISEILDTPVGTIKSRMSYAMKQLKEILEKRRG